MSKLSKVTILGIFAVMFLMGIASQAMAEGKIGYVDLSKLFDEYYKTKDYDQVLQAEHKKYQDEGQKKVDAYQAAQAEVAIFTGDKKKAKETEIEKMKSALMEFDQQTKTTLTKERNEKIREILLEIEKIVSSYAEKGNYEYILNDKVLIYGKPTFDVTEDILKILNENKPSDAKAADSKNKK
jgi:outer membrane protein